MTELHILNFVNLHKEAYYDYEPDASDDRKEGIWPISVAKIYEWQASQVIEYMPDRDKEARAHASSALLEDGRIYFPADKKWSKI